MLHKKRIGREENNLSKQFIGHPNSARLVSPPKKTAKELEQIITIATKASKAKRGIDISIEIPPIRSARKADDSPIHSPINHRNFDYPYLSPRLRTHPPTYMRSYQAKKIPVPPRTIHSPIKDPNCDNNIKVRIRDGRTIDKLKLLHEFGIYRVPMYPPLPLIDDAPEVTQFSPVERTAHNPPKEYSMFKKNKDEQLNPNIKVEINRNNSKSA